ncbi:b(0,+)-type amino acid transporter 1-like isoform X1 [Salvelinus fontinalis]|uniref:b(0,+)-type amino acid transporter 1-like isoform X1 n=1 Tax=Salvelinus fontinalis TaxID=8038 RepID=UPI00248601E4|nr:b(0,+)-type amino acid transporter 1-like isoform X1 [Salvelinus fontinalis]
MPLPSLDLVVGKTYLLRIDLLPSLRMAAKTQKLSLKREVGLIGAISFIAGTMMGSGIFMSPQSVLVNIGSPGASLVIWAACGLLATLGSLCYAELGTVISESGAEYIYILRIFGQVVAFMFVFSFVIVMRPASATGIALSFAEYAVAPFYHDCTPPELLVKCVAAAGILVLAIVNSMNVRLAMFIQVFSMVIKLVALGVIIIGGVVLLFKGNTDNFEDSFKGTNVEISSIGISLYQGLWSYDGWNTLNYVTEELKRPEVNLPRAVIIAIPMVTILYLLVNVSYLAAMTPRELMSSNAVAVTWGNKVLGSWGWVMSIAAALSAFGSLNGTFFSGGRVCFVAAREGHMPDILSMAHVNRLTPSPALIFTTAISLLVLIPGDFQSIVNFFSFTAWFFYAITLSGLLYLKIKKPELPRPYRVPIVIPILVIIAAIFLVLAPIIDNPAIEYLYVTLFIFSGVLFYVPFIHFKLCPGLLEKVTVFLQLFLEVAPADKNL